MLEIPVWDKKLYNCTSLSTLQNMEYENSRALIQQIRQNHNALLINSYNVQSS